MMPKSSYYGKGLKNRTGVDREVSVVKEGLGGHEWYGHRRPSHTMEAEIQYYGNKGRRPQALPKLPYSKKSTTYPKSGGGGGW